MIKLRRLAAWGVLCLALAPRALWAAPADILTQIPDDATGVVVIKDISTLQTQLQNYATQLHLPLPPNMVTTLLQGMGISKGFNIDGAAGLVMVKMPAPKEGQTPAAKPYVLLLPTVDPKSMLETLQPTAPDNGISTVTLPNQTESGFVATVGKFVAVAQEKEVLATFLAHKGTMDKLNPRLLAAFDTNDLVLYGNMATLHDLVAPQIDGYAAMFKGLALATGQAQAMTKDQRALQDASQGMVLDALKQFLADAQGALVTGRLNEKGLTLGVASFFKPDTTMSKLALAANKCKPVDLVGLPNGNFLLAGAMAWDPASKADMVGKMAERLTAAPDLGAQAVQLKRILGIEKQMAATSQGVKFVVAAPGNDLKKMWASLVVDSNDPEKLESLLVEAASQPVLDTDPDVTTKITVEPAAETVSKVRLTRYTIKMTLRAATPDHPIAEEKLKALGVLTAAQGEKGFVVYSGVTTKKMVLFVGTDMQQAALGIQALQNNTADLANSADIKTLQDSVLKSPTGVVYVPVERWIGLVQAVTAPSTQPAGLALGGGAPPLAISTTAGVDSMAGEILLPKALLLNLVQRYSPMPALAPGEGQ